jgi:hypothetical protein
MFIFDGGVLAEEQISDLSLFDDELVTFWILVRNEALSTKSRRGRLGDHFYVSSTAMARWWGWSAMR